MDTSTHTMDYPLDNPVLLQSHSSSPWVSIARRKRAARAAAIPPKWSISASLLPTDPPHPSLGPQSVLHIPSQLLSAPELEITEGHTVATLLSAIARKRYTAAEVVDAFSHRAAIAHQLTNCLTEPLFAQAATRAAWLDDYLQTNGEVVGPLHGLPVSVKDTFNIDGVDSSTGLASLCFKPAKGNAALVDLLLSLGAVIVGKTNVPQTMASLDSVNNVFGRTMNPVNRLVTAGGSSGGEGVMVAMKGCMIGIGTDIGGSIRIPAMVNGVYGFKPSQGRLPYGGQAAVGVDGMSRAGISAVAGPIARSMADIDYVMKELVPRSPLFGEDCVYGAWGESSLPAKGSAGKGEIVIGVLRSDGNCTLLPPIDKILTEVAASLNNHPNIKVVEVPTPKAWTRSQSVMSKLMGIEGASVMADLIESTKEPMVPWMSTRFRKGKPRQLMDVAAIQAQRAALEREMSQIWMSQDRYGRRTRKIDAIICPLASHPVPEIERYNAVGYTSSFVLLDYPAGTLPVREFTEADLELGKAMPGKSISSWDEKSRELWDEKTVDRKVYLGTKLSVQVVVPRLEDDRLAKLMTLIDGVVHGEGAGPKSKL
jgi:Asp-tRNA(Asn)/Glu-tRNA(Gln) amidotransferase A subunit family amidase